MKSPKFSFKETGKKVAIGAGIALLGTLATYLQDTIPGIDFGGAKGLVVAINSILVNIIRNYIREIK